MPDSSSNLTFPILNGLNPGKIEIQILAKLGLGIDEYDYFNNSTIIRFSIIKEITILPFIEDFENGINDTLWTIENIDLDKTWKSDSTNGLQWSYKSAAIKLFTYAPRNNQKDGLISPKINLPLSNELFLTFDIAYQKRSNSNLLNDTLKIFISSNCGLTYDNIIYEKYGFDLSTFDTSTYNFVPEYITHWRNDTVELTNFSNNDVLVKFETTNRAGNNLYLDNIKIFKGLYAPLSVNSKSLEFDIYPNPTGSNIYIKFSNYYLSSTYVKIYNPLGKNLYSSLIENPITLLPTKNLKPGIYFIRLYQSEKSLTKTFIKW